jgi:L-lactate dehydrogenase complex protein LldG
VNREKFLSRIREATAAGRAYRVHLPAFDSQAGYQGAGADPVACLVAEVNTVGGQAQVVANDEEARTSLRQFFEHYKPRSALCWRHPVLDRVGLAQLLEASGIESIDPQSLSDLEPSEQRQRMFAADIGITSVDVAIAETGTLAVASGPVTPRTASLLPPVHIAIVDKAQIVPDLFDLFAKLEAEGPQNLPRNVTLITGPSKTGDLELRLTTGVHGPGHWHVIVIAES